MPSRTFDDDQNVVQLLVLQGGRLMEDAAPDFALAWPKYTAEQITRDTGQPLLNGKFVLIPRPVWDPVKNEQILAFGPHDMKASGHYTVLLNIAFDEPGPLYDRPLMAGLATFLSKGEKFANRIEARCIQLRGG